MQLNRPSSINILSFGAGAIGTYIGGSLLLAGHHLTFIEQPAIVDVLRERGLRLDLSEDKRRETTEAFIIPASAFTIVSSFEEALYHGPFDLGLFALKSYDTDMVLEKLKPFRDEVPALLCFSNGVDNEPTIAAALGAEKVLYGAVTTAIGRHGPGDIFLERLRGIGVAAGHSLSKFLISVMNSALLNGRLYKDAGSMKWSKMLTNLVANPTSAILNMTAAQIFANSNLYAIEIAMLRECIAVMQAMKLEVVDLPGTPVKALALATRMPLWLSKPFLARAAGAGRGGKMPSFHIDLYSGRDRSEVEYLHGAVVRAGRKVGVPTPVNKALTEILLSLTNKEILLDTFAGKPDKLLARIRE